MRSLGETLRRAREQQGRSLSDMASDTCITSRYLAAIEADDPKHVPGAFFYRNYVKQYAKALGLDSDACARAADDLLPHEEVLPAAPASSSIIERLHFTANWRGVAVAISCCAAIAGIVMMPRGPHSAVNSERHTVAAAPARVATEPAQPAPAVDVQGNVNVKVAASEPAWVSISSAGRTLFRGRLQPDEIKHFSGVESAKLWTGNAAALDVQWNGKTIGPLGSRGQVALVLFTPENYRILAPRGL